MHIRPKPFSFEEFKSIYSRVPRMTVEVVVQAEQGVLLAYRRIQPHKNEWSLPGGTVYFKETLEEAVYRVAHEELGIAVTINKFLGFIEYLHEDSAGGFDHPIGHAYLCTPESMTITVNDQADKTKFFTVLPNDMVAEQKIFLEALLPTFPMV